ncbi:putative nuclease HARBI1 [Merluccius polli]|uniref:Nuclease HARBI1 n=1 Tax=Merluccius polli TaxID=89951 RepID=A0AA47N9G0_MERPO|nr:putative nuclease HARBI1 [Merluccius polli]
MADLVLLEDLVGAALRREHAFRPCTDFLADSDDCLLRRYQLPRYILVDLCQQLAPTLERETKRKSAIPIEVQLLTTLTQTLHYAQGAIDCTHIALRSPSHNEFNHVNRKGFRSVKVQLICNAQLELLNVVVRWPGTTHDSFVLHNSSMGLRLQGGAVEDGWLIAKLFTVCWHI